MGKHKSIIPSSVRDHNEFPVQCSTKYLEKLEQDSKEGKDVDPEFLKELSKRRSRPNCRTIRLARNARWQEYKKGVAERQAANSGDPRKMK